MPRIKMSLKDFALGMEPHVYRFWNALIHPRTEGYKGRKGYQDVLHAYTNIDVEAARLDPYIYGHIIVYLRVIRWVSIATILYMVH